MRISQQSELQKFITNIKVLIYCFKETFLSKTLHDFMFSSLNVTLDSVNLLSQYLHEYGFSPVMKKVIIT